MTEQAVVPPVVVPARRTWDPPYRLKAAYVIAALVSIAGLFASKIYDRAVMGTVRAKMAMEVEEMDTPAPDFELQDADGKPVRLSEIKGKLVMVNFWATWCPPCRDEMPSMGQLARALKDEPFEMLAVSVDDGWEPIQKFFGSAVPEYRVLLDTTQAHPRKWGTEKYPETYLVRDGKVVAKFVGSRDWNDPAAFKVIRSYLRS